MAWIQQTSLRGPQGAPGADGGTTPHAARHATGGTDPVSPASIGAATSGHTHPYVATTAVGAASGVASLDANTRVPTAQMPRVPTTVRTVAYAATISLDPTVNGNVVNITATGAITSLGFAAGAVDGQVIRVRVIASGAQNVTVASAVRTSTGLSRGPYPVPTGQALIAAFEYIAGLSAWVLTAATTSAT